MLLQPCRGCPKLQEARPSAALAALHLAQSGLEWLWQGMLHMRSPCVLCTINLKRPYVVHLCH